MSRRYRNKSNKVAGAVVSILAIALLVGGLGAVTKGFKDWNYKDWFKASEPATEEETRVGLVTIDVTSEVKGSTFTETSIISFLNENLEDPIFKDVATITETDESTGEEKETSLLGYVYQDNGGMKFGSSSQRGYFTINLVENYSFNRCKIVGRNYSALNNTTSIYSCDETSISVNGAEMQTFGTNAEDTTLIAPTQELKFNFGDKQTQFTIATEGKRCTLFSIELWTE